MAIIVRLPGFQKKFLLKEEYCRTLMVADKGLTSNLKTVNVTNGTTLPCSIYNRNLIVILTFIDHEISNK